MRERRIIASDFDLVGFADVVIRFLGGVVSQDVHPSYAIVKVATPGGVPEYGPEGGRSNFFEELETGHILFFPFSSSNIGEPVPCADGNSRELEDDSDFIMGDVDCVGFLIQLKEQEFRINSAVHAGGASPGPLASVDIKDCDVFDNGMETFIDGFILS